MNLKEDYNNTMKMLMMKKVDPFLSSSSSSSLRQPIIRSIESSSIKEDHNNKHLPDDVLTEIFLRLPFQSILNFRYVSKLWRSLLNPSFIAKWMEFNNCIPPPWVLFYKLDLPINQSVSIASPDHHSSQFISNHDGFSFKFLNLKAWPIHQQEKNLFFIGSSNGLVLCSTSRNYDYDDDGRYYVCNPLSKKWVLLPPSPTDYFDRWFIHGFICESFSSLDSRTTSYRVVRIPLFENPSTYIDLEIFNSSNGVWETYKIACPQEVTMVHSSNNIVSRNEVLYWIEGRNRIIAYDLFRMYKIGGHLCRLINLPEQARGDDDFGCLGESEGFISYSHCHRGQLSVWVLEDYFSRGSWVWRLVHKIKVKDMVTENCEDWFIDLVSHNPVNLKPLAFNPGDENVMILGYGNSSIFAYNIKTKRLKLLTRDSFYSSTTLGALPFVLVPWPATLCLPPFGRDP